MMYELLPQEHRESKKRLEEIVDELKKELSAAEHQLQKNTMEIKVLAYFYMHAQCNWLTFSRVSPPSYMHPLKISQLSTEMSMEFQLSVNQGVHGVLIEDQSRVLIKAIHKW